MNIAQRPIWVYICMNLYDSERWLFEIHIDVDDKYLPVEYNIPCRVGLCGVNKYIVV